MIGQALTAARLLSGQWTPFLSPWVDDESVTVPPGSDEEPVASFGAAIRQVSRATHVFPTVSGREAIHAALRASTDGRRRRVIVPSFACRGVVDPIIAAGLTPVFADIDEDLNLSASSVMSVLDEDCVAVVAPHTCGVWNASIDAIVSAAHATGARVIEDVAQAQGLTHEGRAAGSVGDCAVFSTGLGKLIFAHGGGAVVTSDRALAQRLAALPWTEFAGDEAALIARWHARLRSPLRRGLTAVSERLTSARAVAPHDAAALDVAPSPRRMTAAMARTALAQVALLPQILARRRMHAERWIELLKAARWPHEWRTAPLAGAVQLKFWLDVPAELASRLQLHFWRSGVEVEPLYLPLHRQPRYSAFPRSDLGRTDHLAARVFSLPVRPGLDERDFRRIERAVQTWRP